ncbi:MAG: outer membrane beta-barrel protein [Bacteroidales bacterium]|nr:outer membrane beta-barrel protein [Bacteroidales bacterium]
MRNVKFCIAAIAALVMGMSIANAQITVRAGVGLPMGSFADGSNTDWGVITGENGVSALGYNAGIEYRIPLVSDLSLMFTGDFMYSGLTSEAKDNLDKINCSAPSYFNIPLMAGANYNVKMGNSLSLFVEGGLGLNVRLLTDATVPIVGDISFKPAFTFAFQGGAGVKFQERYSLDVNYYVLGKADVKGTYTLPIIGETDYTGGSLAPQFLTIRLGYDF